MRGELLVALTALVLVACGDDSVGASGGGGSGGAEQCLAHEAIDCAADGQSADCVKMCSGTESNGWLSHGVTTIALPGIAPQVCRDGCPGVAFAVLSVGIPNSADCIAVSAEHVVATVVDSTSPDTVCDTSDYASGCNTWELGKLLGVPRRLVLAVDGLQDGTVDATVALWAGDCGRVSCADGECMR